MPESEEKKELGGLARSIDSLFSEDASSSDEHVETAATEDAAETHVTDGDGPSAPMTGEAAEIAEEEASTTDVVAPEDAPPAEEAPLDDEPRLETTELDVPGEAWGGGEPPAEDEPGPLALAVESFLAGGGDAGRVRTLAEGHLDAREFTPVAQAVERLVHQAGYEPGSDAASLVDDLLSPIVRSRIVQRLGQERHEALRHVFHEVCRALGTPMAEAIRDEMADTGDRFARRAYFDALVAMGEASLPVIEAMAEDDNRFLARNGVAILGEVGGSRAVELVVSAIANTDPRVRKEALLAMARMKVEHADEIIVGRIVDDTDESVRLAAIVTAGELRIERAVRPLVAALDEAYETDEVLPLLHALGQIADPGAVASIEKHAVRERFAKPRTDVRIAAYQALNHIGTPHARRLLNQAVSDKDAEVKTAVKEMLHMR